MKTIWKFEIKPNNEQVQMPKGAKPLWVATQRETPYLWCEVDTEAPLVWRSLYSFGTGHHVFNDKSTYVGSFMLLGGDLVFHTYLENE